MTILRKPWAGEDHWAVQVSFALCVAGLAAWLITLYWSAPVDFQGLLLMSRRGAAARREPSSGTRSAGSVAGSPAATTERPAPRPHQRLHVQLPAVAALTARLRARALGAAIGAAHGDPPAL